MEAPASQIRRICAQDRSRTCQLECFVTNASRPGVEVGVAVPGRLGPPSPSGLSSAHAMRTVP